MLEVVSALFHLFGALLIDPRLGCEVRVHACDVLTLLDNLSVFDENLFCKFAFVDHKVVSISCVESEDWCGSAFFVCEELFREETHGVLIRLS